MAFCDDLDGSLNKKALKEVIVDTNDTVRKFIFQILFLDQSILHWELSTNADIDLLKMIHIEVLGHQATFFDVLVAFRRTEIDTTCIHHLSR